MHNNVHVHMYTVGVLHAFSDVGNCQLSAEPARVVFVEILQHLLQSIFLLFELHIELTWRLDVTDPHTH